jgi:hypothetical protein
MSSQKNTTTRKPRQCSICKEEGHDSRKHDDPTQKKKKTKEAQVAVDLEFSTLSDDDSHAHDVDILSANYWKNTKTFKTIKTKETQLKYYKRMESCDEVLQLVSLESKPFGSVAENIIQAIFKMGARTSTQNDGTRNGKKIEIKCARYWAGKDNCRWQHLEPEHDYDIAMLVVLDFQGLKVWCIQKSILMGEMCDKKIVTKQGKQGCWVEKSAIEPYLTPIKSITELDEFINAMP